MDLALRTVPLRSMIDFFEEFSGIGQRSCQPRNLIKADLLETNEAYIAKFDVPGRSRDAIGISYENDILTVSVQEIKDQCSYMIRERSYEKSSRSFRIPGVDENSISAALENGVLTVTINKEKAKRKIEIKV